MKKESGKWETLKEKIKVYKKSTGDKLKQRKLFSDMIDTFIQSYQEKGELVEYKPLA